MIAILRSIRILVGGLALGALALMIVGLGGCQPGVQPGETYHKLTVAWPIFDVEKSEGVGQDGVRWTKEKGDAVFWLASWEKTQKFDNGNNEIYDKERSTGLPFYNAQREESQQFIKTWGSVLLFPYESYTDKNAACGLPPATVGPAVAAPHSSTPAAGPTLASPVPQK
jgi:hypothetical protein